MRPCAVCRIIAPLSADHRCGSCESWFGKLPPEHAPQILDALMNAVYRYEILIGMCDLGDKWGVTEQMVSDDTGRFSHLIRPKVNRGGMLITEWVDADCVVFMNAVTGIDPELCGKVLSTYNGSYEDFNRINGVIADMEGNDGGAVSTA